MREQILARQKELGLVPQNTELPPLNPVGTPTIDFRHILFWFRLRLIAGPRTTRVESGGVDYSVVGSVGGRWGKRVVSS